MDVSNPIYGSVLLPGEQGPAGIPGLAIWATATRLSTIATTGVVLAPGSRSPQPGDLIMSYNTDSLGYLGEVTSVETLTSVTVSYLANLAGFNGDWDTAVTALLDNPESKTRMRLAGILNAATVETQVMQQRMAANQTVPQNAWTEVKWGKTIRDDLGASLTSQGDTAGFKVADTGWYDINVKIAWHPYAAYTVVALWSPTAIVDGCHSDQNVIDQAGTTLRRKSDELHALAYLTASTRYTIKAYTYTTGGVNIAAGEEPQSTIMQIASRRGLSL